MITLKNISKKFGSQVIFDNFDLAVSNGERVLVSAPSGRGKTTLFNLIAELIKPDSGVIEGIPDKIAYVFQEDRLFEGFTARANLKAIRDDISDYEIEEIFNELMLSDSIDKRVSELSGGMKRRVAIARALIAGGELIILDEPFKGLDPETKSAVVECILKRTEGKTILIASHDEEDAKSLGARVIEI